MSAEFITILANVALTLSLIVAIIFGIAELRTAKRDRNERLTLETLRAFQTREFAELINYITSTQFPKTHNEWEHWKENDKIKFIQFSQQMESLGMLLAEKLISIDLVDKTLGSFVTSSWKKYERIILELRVKNSDPYLSEYFQWMAHQIEERMKLNPRKPFFQ